MINCPVKITIDLITLYLHKYFLKSQNNILQIVKNILLFIKFSVLLHSTLRGGAVVARWAHNPKVAGSSPAPATN